MRMMESKIAILRGKEIRKTIHNNEWWFSVVDVCAALTDSSDAGAYWRKLKQRLSSGCSEVVTNCHGVTTARSRREDERIQLRRHQGSGGSGHNRNCP
jgi:hypothetical protein